MDIDTEALRADEDVILTLLDRLAAAEANRDRLLRVAEAAREHRAACHAVLATEAVPDRMRAMKAMADTRDALDIAIAALDAKDPAPWAARSPQSVGRQKTTEIPERPSAHSAAGTAASVRPCGERTTALHGYVSNAESSSR